MADQNLSDLSQDPELAAWLDQLKKEATEKQSNRQSKVDIVRLPLINMGKKFNQVNGVTYPEQQGSINFLPVPFNGQRVTELKDVLILKWVPTSDDWSTGRPYYILPDEFYPEGEIRTRIANARSKINSLLDSGKISWQEASKKKFSLIKALVLVHKNTKGDVVVSNLYDKNTLTEHKYIPAVIVCPNLKVQTAIQNDLNQKINPIPYAIACYSDTPLKERKGWVSMTFKQGSGFGYDVTVSTDLVNPVINPEGIIPSDFNWDDPKVKLLETADPVREFIPNFQLGQDCYWNEESLKRLEERVNDMVSKAEPGAQTETENQPETQA